MNPDESGTMDLELTLTSVVGGGRHVGYVSGGLDESSLTESPLIVEIKPPYLVFTHISKETRIPRKCLTAP